MVRHPLRPTLLILLAAWLTIIAFAAHLLLSAQISRWEGHFDEDVQLMAGEVKQKLDTNEAVLAGFSAFLHAVTAAIPTRRCATPPLPHLPTRIST
jgi:hypothetical protein